MNAIAAENKIVLQLMGRVFKKTVFSSSIIFLDIIATKFHIICSNNCLLSGIPGILKYEEDQIYIFHVTVKTNHKDNKLSSNYFDITAGDLVDAIGILENKPYNSSSTYNNSNKNIYTNILIIPPEYSHNNDKIDIIKINEWDKNLMGLFKYNDSLSIKTVSIGLPSIIIQCKDNCIERISLLLISIYPKLIIRRSSIEFINKNDKLILLYANQDANINMNEIISNDILSQAIKRIYPLNYEKCLLTCYHSDLNICLDIFRNKIKSLLLDIKGIRIQTFPRELTKRITIFFENDEFFQWSPSQYSHVLSVVAVDGIWLLSLIPTDEIFIGHIFDNISHYNSSSNHNDNNNNNNNNNRLCKAVDKIREIMTRNGWLSPEIRYRLGFDVGSSPGGWTSFLVGFANTEKVISVDKGDMSQVDSKYNSQFEHWQMDGKTAIEQFSNYINNDNNNYPLIDIYCCDANIHPSTAVELLQSAVEKKILAKNAKIIITLKNSFKNKNEWEKQKQNVIIIISQYFDNIELIHLLANTPKEITISGILK